MKKQQTNFQEILTKINKSGISDYKLADMLDINRQRLTAWRNGTRKTVDYDSGCGIVGVLLNLE